jgi:Fe-S oxidoreductase
MNPFRDTFWNIPRWAEILLYVSQGLGLAILFGKLYLRAQLWRRGQGELSADRLKARLGRVIKYAVAQAHIVRERYAGIFHLSLFLAMIVLFIGTALATIDYDIGVLILDVKLLQGPFYLIYELALDFFAVVGILGLVLAMIRRVYPRPDKLTYSFGFAVMLWLFLVDLVSGLLVEAFRLAAVQPPWAAWSFAGYLISRGILGLGLSTEALRTAHLATWVFHFCLTGLLYAVALDLPIKHILYSTLNVFFAPFQEAGVLTPLDLEDESVERLGAGQIIDLTPAQLLSGDACTECGRCQVVCPAYMAGTPLNPKQVVLDIRQGLDRYGPAMLNGGPDDEMPIVRSITPEEALWACTTCRACVEQCPVLIDQLSPIVDMRRYLVLTAGKMPDLLASAMTQAERAGNPWGNPKGSRMDWARGLKVPLMSDKKKADVLYWVGCAGAYDPEGQRTARAMVKIFEAAGIDYAVLGEEERCNCEWARRAGNEYLYQQATHSNIAVFDKYEFNLLVTHCPHCFNTFKNEYPQLGGRYEVEHHSTYIARLIRHGYLKLGRPSPRRVTYHDPCYLGRYNEIYNPPRDALMAVQGISLVEMARNRNNGLCCGGGGAQVWFETHQQRPVNLIRLEEAIQTGAGEVAAACPFCVIMLSSAAQSMGVRGQVAIRDIAVIIAEALAPGVE